MGSPARRVMKSKTFSLNLLSNLLLLIIVTTVYLPNCLAQNYTQMGLPDGAKARLGKGRITDLLYSPNGNILAVVSSIGIWLYDTKNYQELNLLPIPKNRSRAMAHRITNTTFSVDGQELLSETDEKLILLWNVSTGENIEINQGVIDFFSNYRQTRTIETENKSIKFLKRDNENIEKPSKEKNEKDVKIAYSPDGQTYATANDAYTVMIRDTRTRKLKKRIFGYPELAYLSKISISPDGKILASLRRNYFIRLWDVNTRKLKKSLVGHKVTTISNKKRGPYAPFTKIDSVAFSPDGKILAIGSLNGMIRLWDTSSGKLKRTLLDQIGFIKSLTFSPDGKSVASGSDDGSILVWNIETWKNKPFLAERMDSISCVSFSRDGSMLAGGNLKGDIHLFDVASRKLTKTFTGHTGEISYLIFSPDGSKIASSSWDGSTRLWDIETGELVKTLSAPVFVHFNLSCRALLFTDDGNLLGINEEYDFIHIWNVNTGQYKQMLMGHASHLLSFSISGDGKTLASSNADGTVMLWDLTSITNAVD